MQKKITSLRLPEAGKQTVNKAENEFNGGAALINNKKKVIIP